VLSDGDRLARLGTSHAAENGESDASLRLGDSSWPETLSKRIEELHQRGRSHLTIELEPESLGKLVLRIEADRNHVTAWVSTQNEDAKSALLSGSSALRQHLEEQGLTLGQFTVDVGQRGGEHRFTQAWPSRKQGSRAFRGSDGQSTGVTALRPVRAYSKPDRLINVLA
jgi:flagellar hook-length control protein FliK